MSKFVISTLAYLVANGIGLLLAALMLPGFKISVMAFLLAVVIFSGAQALAGPLLTRFSPKSLPQLQGAVALIAVAAGLMVTDLLMPAMQTGGISNFLAATLLIWLGSLIAAILLPIYLFPSLRVPKA